MSDSPVKVQPSMSPALLTSMVFIRSLCFIYDQTSVLGGSKNSIVFRCINRTVTQPLDTLRIRTDGIIVDSKQPL